MERTSLELMASDPRMGATQDATRGSRKSNIDRLLTAGALSREAPAAPAPHPLQTAPRRFQLQVLSNRGFSAIVILALVVPSGSHSWCMAPSASTL